MPARRFLPLAVVAITLALLSSTPASAADPRSKCLAAKLKAAGKSAACRTAALAKIAKGEKADVGACDAGLTRAFAQAERIAGDACPTEGDAEAIRRVTDAQAAMLHESLGGGRFVDNGDGTILDRRLGLQWEKKVEGSGCLHCVEDRYTWSAITSAADADGTAFTSFLRALNACDSADGSHVVGGFAGHCDWRLPNYDELRSIFDFDACFVEGPSCVPAIFGPTAPAYYWTPISLLYEAWYVDFIIGFDGLDSKHQAHAVRAVRTLTQ